MDRRVPSASNPQLLTRLVDLIARNLRTVASLREALGVTAQTVRNYVGAARWLGFVHSAEPLRLTSLGLAYVYAGQRQPLVYVQAVWANPAAADLLIAGDGRLPEVAQVERAIREREPDLAGATVRRRASAVRSLVAPAVGRMRPHAPGQDELQLALPLGHAAAAERAPAPPMLPAEPDDPDVYRFVWSLLLDYGEVPVEHLGPLLSRVGADGVDPGEAILRAQARGDAVLDGQRLVVTAASVRRRELAGSTSSVILSDPDYRAYLRLLAATRSAAPPPLAARFAAWDRWLFGEPATDVHVHEAMRGLLLERSLEAFPIARGDALLPPVAASPFLDTWELPGLPIALPPSLSQLLGGPDAIQRLAEEGGGPVDAGPSVLAVPHVFHGGLRSPRETPGPLGGVRPRAVRRCPGMALVAALLLLHRQRPHRFSVGLARKGWSAHVGSGDPWPLLAFLEGFAEHRRWVFARRPGGGLDAPTLLRVAEALGIAEVVGRLAVLAESLAVELSPQGELSALQALTDAVAEWIDGGGARP